MRRIALLALALATSCGGGPDLKPIEWQVRRGELAEARAALDAVPADQRDARFTALARRVDAALAELERVRAGIATVEAEREGLELDEVLARLKRLDPASEAAEELVSIARSAAVDWDAERRARSGFQLRPRYEEEEDLEPVVAQGPEEPVDAFVRDDSPDAYARLIEPRWVVAWGACAISGGAYDNYATIAGLSRILPVDVVVPGCPPAPEAFREALELLRSGAVRDPRVASSEGRDWPIRSVE